MCLILTAFNTHPRHRLILLANRDEFYDRATAPLQFWEDYPDILAGRDLEQQGTWMGVTRGGRLAAITNYRSPNTIKNAPSRGHLVSDYLTGNAPPADYMIRIRAEAQKYNGFNLIVGDQTQLYYFSNRGGKIRVLAPGIYGLSNHLLDTPWPKVQQGKHGLAALLNNRHADCEAAFFELLQRQEIPPDNQLPATGVDRAWERMLSPVFITSPTYGTRSSAIILVGRDGHLSFTERTWVPARPTPLAASTRHYAFKLKLPGIEEEILQHIFPGNRHL